MTRRRRLRLLEAAAAGFILLAMPRFSAAAVCTTTQSADLATLTLVGNGSIQVLQVTDLGTSVVVSLDCNNNGSFLDGPTVGDVNAAVFTGVQTINLQLGGHDTITYAQGAVFDGLVRELKIQLGPGLGANSVTLTGGFAIQNHSSVVVDLAGGANLDTVVMDFSGSTVDTSVLEIYTDLGSGSDSLTVKEPAITNGRVDLDAELGTGNNLMTLVADQPVSGSILRADIGGSDGAYDVDSVTTSLSGTFDASSRAYVATNLRGGDDKYLGTFDLGSFKVLNASEVRFRVNGGSGKDFISIGDGSSVGPAQDDGLVELILRGGPNADAMALDWNGLTGSGTFRYRANAGTFDDFVATNLLTDAGSFNTLDLAVQGGRGKDFLYSAVFDPGGNATYGSLGAGIFDGNFDFDRCIAFGDGSVLLQNCEPAP